MIDKDAAKWTLIIFGSVALIIAVVSLLVWGGLTMWETKCDWGVGLEVAGLIFLAMLYVYFELKNL